jgi:hypothetical protein
LHGEELFWNHIFFSKSLFYHATVPLKSVDRYINEVVATRKLPLSAKTIKTKVVMKMDIEVSVLRLL